MNVFQVTDTENLAYLIVIHNDVKPASGKHVNEKFTPHIPLLYSKTGVCRDIHMFLIIAPKHKH